MAAPIVIIGSTNTDMVIRADHIPLPGETVMGGSFFMNPGGKGANQAVAAARLGASVIFICKTGDDVFGRRAQELFRAEGIRTEFMLTDPLHPSGVAMITLDRSGENSIVVAPGANHELHPEDFKEEFIRVIVNADFLLMQLEIPLKTVEFLASLATKKARIILNPAPAFPLPDGLLSQVDILTPNETEAERLTGIKIDSRGAAEKAALDLRDRGVGTVIITLGPEGALLLHENHFSHIPADPVEAIDSTAAGDVFNGALVAALSEGVDMENAVGYACKAASLSVTRLGAQASAPFKNEIYVPIQRLD
jgi:ribokinase